MQNFQGNSFETQYPKATDWADMSTVLNSFEPQDEFQIFMKRCHISFSERMKTMENVFMSGLSSLHRKMDSLSTRYSMGFGEDVDSFYQQLVKQQARDKKKQTSLDLQRRISDLLILATHTFANKPPTYDEIFGDLDMSTQKHKDDSPYQITFIPDLAKNLEKEKEATASNGIKCVKNILPSFDALMADWKNKTDKLLANGRNKPPTYDEIFRENNLNTFTTSSRDASDNTTLHEGPVYINDFTDEIATEDKDEQTKYNGNTHSTEENCEFTNNSIDLTDKGKVCTNETAKMNNGFKKQQDKTMSEENINGFSGAMMSVGILYLPHCISTVFRAGTLYGITAAHIFTAGKNVHEEQIRALLGHRATVVDFGPFNQHLEKFKLVEAVFIDMDLDIAILKFRDEDKHKLPPPLYLFSNCDMSEFVDEVAVIGVGHPNNNLKILEHDVKVIKRSKIPTDEIDIYLQNNYESFKNKCISKGVGIGVLDESYKGMLYKHNIILDAFSGHGASGAPVLSKTNPVTVIGVFTSGYPKIVYHIPELLSVFPSRFTFECATKTSDIFLKLFEFREDLANDIFTEKME